MSILTHVVISDLNVYSKRMKLQQRSAVERTRNSRSLHFSRVLVIILSAFELWWRQNIRDSQCGEREIRQIQISWSLRDHRIFHFIPATPNQNPNVGKCTHSILNRGFEYEIFYSQNCSPGDAEVRIPGFK